MRKLIAGIIAGVCLGATGTAVAAQSYLWSEHGSGYSCNGITAGVICKSGNYEFGATRDYVYIQQRNTQDTFGCRKRSSFYQCFSG